MKRMILPAIMIAGLVMTGCQDDTPEPEVSTPPATSGQPTTPPPYAGTDTTAPGQNPAQTQTRQPSIDDVQKITVDELVALREAGQVTVVDVRSAQAYVQGHIPGSINIPANQTQTMINMIPKGKRIVTYCT